MLSHDNFSFRDTNNFFSRGTTVVCLKCKKHGLTSRHPDRYTCTGPCKKLLPISAYCQKDMKAPMARDLNRLMCKTCKKAGMQKLRHLRELLNKSKRKRCTCQRTLTHAEKCPMHVSFAGERPYPGCDVMSKADSGFFAPAHEETEKMIAGAASNYCRPFTRLLVQITHLPGPTSCCYYSFGHTSATTTLTSDLLCQSVPTVSRSIIRQL